MKTTFTTNSIRAALVLLAASAAMARGFQQNNGVSGKQVAQAPRANAPAPARSSRPAAPATTNRSMPMSVKTTGSTPTTKTTGAGQSGSTNVTKATVSKGTQANPRTSTGYTNTNTNINKNTNININRNTNSNSWNTGSGRLGTDPQGRGTNLGGPQRTAFSGNTNSNVNSNVNINKNINVNQNGGRGSGMVRNHSPRIDEGQFRSHFGRDHEFHVRPQVVDGRSRFQYNGVSFGLMAPLPVSWRYTDPVFVDLVGGAYFLCNRMYPGIRVPVDIADCTSCTQAPELAANNVDCADCDASNGSTDAGSVPTLVPGETANQVVAALGTPKDIVDLGMRKIYLYGDMRVTFVGGRLTDVR